MTKLHKTPGIPYVPQILYRPAKSAMWALLVAVVGYTSLTASLGAPETKDGPAERIAAPYEPAADPNTDGQVNVADLSIVLSEWGTADAESDLNGNGTVDIADLSVVLSNWSQ